MVYFELKKIFSRMGSRIALVFLLAILIFVSYSAIAGVDYTNAQGDTVTGLEAVRSLREATEEWSGSLTEEKIAAVIARIQEIRQMPEWNSTDVREQDQAYHLMQGLTDIQNMIIKAFSAFQVYDYTVFDGLKPEDAADFYSRRTAQLQEWLEGEGAGWYRQPEQEYLLRRYRAQEQEAPLYYEYIEGWKQLLNNSPAILMITVLTLGYLVSGIFSCEYQLNADAVFYSARHGRGKAVRAKLTAGFLLTTAVYWSMMLLYSAVVLGVAGTDGAGCMIRTSLGYWKSLYSLTWFQVWLLMLGAGYLASLLLVFLTMLVSAKARSAVVAVMVPFALIFLPNFLSNFEHPLMEKILGLLPDRLLIMGETVKFLTVYQIGGMVFGEAEMLSVLYGILTLLVVPVIYRTASRAEIT